MSRWWRYTAVEWIGAFLLYVIAEGFDTMEAGWICGALAAMWMALVGFIKRVRE